MRAVGPAFEPPSSDRCSWASSLARTPTSSSAGPLGFGRVAVHEKGRNAPVATRHDSFRVRLTCLGLLRLS